MVFFTSQSDKFLSTSNTKLVLTQMAATAVLAVPVALLLLSGYIDFAVGSTAGLAGVFMGMYLQGGDKNVVVGVLIAIGVGVAVGATQGLLATKLTLSPIIVTLGFYTGVRGLVFVIGGGKVKSRLGPGLVKIGRGTVPGTSIPYPVAIAAVLLLLGWLFHTRTRWGRHVVSLGVSPEASRRAGISLNTLPFLIYAATGACAGIAAIILAARLDAAPPTLGDGLEIEVLSAVLLGGVAFGGGKGSMVGVAAGVLFIGFLNNGLLLMGAPPFWLRVSSGAALVAGRGVGRHQPLLRPASPGRRLTWRPPTPGGASTTCSSPIASWSSCATRSCGGRSAPVRASTSGAWRRSTGSRTSRSARRSGASRARGSWSTCPSAVWSRPTCRCRSSTTSTTCAGSSSHRCCGAPSRRPVPTHVTRLRAAFDALERSAAGDDAERSFSEVHWDFHWMLLEPGATGEITRLVRRLWRVADRYVLLTKSVAHDVAAEQHHQLVDAFVAGEAEQAAEILLRHLHLTGDALRVNFNQLVLPGLPPAGDPVPLAHA